MKEILNMSKKFRKTRIVHSESKFLNELPHSILSILSKGQKQKQIMQKTQ
jgi:hypothetical protein